MSGALVALVVAAAAATAPTAAGAQYGRLVDTSRIVALAKRACVAGSPDHQRAVAAIAGRERWDEYGKRPGTPATTRAWLVSLAGQPAIVDIERNGPVSRCSVNAVSDPNAVGRAVATLVGREPDRTAHPQGGTVRTWRATRAMPLVTVTNAPGQAMTRLTVTSAR
jgi:hypothetical protein